MFKDRQYQKIISVVVLVLIAGLIGRFAWLVNQEHLEFDSDINGLIPKSNLSRALFALTDKISADQLYEIVVVIQNTDGRKVDSITDQVKTLIEKPVGQAQYLANRRFNLMDKDLAMRINALTEFKSSLLAANSKKRILHSSESQLAWRLDQFLGFPPLALSDPETDPLGTVEEFVLENLPTIDGVSFDGVYLRSDFEVPTNILMVDVNPSQDENASDDAVIWYTQQVRNIEQEQDIEIFLTGFPLYSAIIAQQTKKEIQWMGLSALLFTIFVFLIVAKSIIATLISAISIILVLIGGLVITQMLVGLPHLIGLTLATTAIGICIDFALHFWTHARSGFSAERISKKISPGINMSFMTTTIGLMVVVFISIPVLSQTAVFLCSALFIIWLIVHFLFPLFTIERASARNLSTEKYYLKKEIAVVLMWIIGFVSLAGIIKGYEFDDRPIVLSREVPQLAMDEENISKSFSKMANTEHIFLIQADDVESLLNAEEQLYEGVSAEKLKSITALSKLVPSKLIQSQNRKIYENARTSLSEDTINNYLEILQIKSLDWGSNKSMEYSLDWLISQPWADAERKSLLYCDPDASECASVLRVAGDDPGFLDNRCITSPFCNIVSLQQRNEEALQTLREKLLQAVFLAFSAMLSVLYVRYRKKAFKMILVPISAAIAGVAAVSLLGLPITTFTIAAVFPLLGLSIDYVVFSKETTSESAETYLAIFASALTTAVTFGILSFSGTPAVQFFCIPLCVGILAAWVGMCAIRENYEA